MILFFLSEATATTCDGWAPDSVILDVSGVTLESSGLAPASLRPNVWFTHGDHGGDAVLYAFDDVGAPRGIHELPGVPLVDWEDLADAPCPDEGRCLYVADIGDNLATRPNIAIHVVREPEQDGEAAVIVATWTAVYPDGPRDAEALLVHPCTGVVYILTKENGTSTVFRMPMPDPTGTVVLQSVATLALVGGAVSGADWDDQGERVVVRNDVEVFIWTTDPASPESHWADEPVRLQSPVLGTGEAVAFGPDQGIWLTAEADPMPLAHLTCLTPTDGAGECAFPQTGPLGCCGDGKQSLFWLPLGPLALLRRRRRPTAEGRSALPGRFADSR